MNNRSSSPVNLTDCLLFTSAQNMCIIEGQGETSLEHKLTIDKRTGLTIRVGTMDAGTIAVSKRSYRDLVIGAGSIVLDAGACFGSFTREALVKGARVVAYEPDPDNFKLLVLNCPAADCRRAALVSGPGSVAAPFYISTGTNMQSHSIVAFKGRPVIRIPTDNFNNVLEEVRPDTVKMDVEGAEYDLLRKPLPRFVRQLAVELHLNKRSWRAQAPDLARTLAEQFTTVVRAPKVGEKNWDTMGVYSR